MGCGHIHCIWLSSYVLYASNWSIFIILDSAVGFLPCSFKKSGWFVVITKSYSLRNFPIAILFLRKSKDFVRVFHLSLIVEYFFFIFVIELVLVLNVNTTFIAVSWTTCYFFFLKSLIYIQSKNKTTKDLYKINLHLTLVNNTIASEVNVLKFLLAYDYNLYTGIT